jgi:hypothetical protein
VVIAVANARVDEDAVMISPGDAALTHIAVLGPRGLEEPTGAAFISGVEESVIIRVERHVVSMILAGNVARVCGAGEVEEHVRHGDSDDDGEFSEEADLGPDLREIQVLGYGHD